MSNRELNQNSRWRSALGILLALCILGAIAAFFWWIIVLFSRLQANILAPTVIGFLTVLSSVLVVVYAKRQERLREAEFQLRQKKAHVYEEFMRVFFHVIFAEKTGRTPPEASEVAREMNDLTRLLIPWGADDVVSKYSRFRRRIIADQVLKGHFASDTIWDLERVLLAMRADLGHTNKGLGKGDLMSLFINDVDKYL